MTEYKGLKYKTRGNVSPQGRPRVFFCCHPNDFERMFDPITKEILDIQINAAIWYYDSKEGIPEGENFFADLSQMQLFVVPVTADFIYSENKARTVEFSFAIDHHIPVLPLLQESGLEKDFNKICGDLQYLDKYAATNDPTALPYADKLKKYLKSVLVSDELAQKIRDAFDAYIFLSYRKKDRKYAQQIMHLIHKNDFCRDIAIWYDEFLIPGENFNDAIEAAMQKSSLFAMVVTPSLLENPNYVMTVEYPEARNQAKTILPIKGKETNISELSALYPEITDVADEYTLPKRLREALLSITLRKNNKGPEHNFLIGQAYLSGIDVETDHEKALKLITSAAEAGLPEAYEKLVSMYRNGEGVKRNYNCAIEWQRKYVKYLECILKQEKTIPNIISVLNNLYYLGSYEQENKKLNDALLTFSHYFEYVKIIAAIPDVFKMLKPIIIASYLRIGDICRDSGKVSLAVESYRNVIKSILSSDNLNDSALYQETLSNAYKRVGGICEKQGKLEEAEAWFRKSLDIEQNAIKEIENLQSLQNLSISFDQLGNLKSNEEKLKEAEKWYQKSLEIRQRLSDISNTPQLMNSIALNYRRLADISRREGDMEKAERLFLKSLEILEKVVEEMNTPDYRRHLAISYVELGDLKRNTNRLKEAKELFSKSFDMFQEIAAETDAIESQCDIAYSYSRFAMIEAKEGNFAKEKEYYLKSMELLEEICTKSENVQHHCELSDVYRKLGINCADEGKLEEAKDWFFKSLDITQLLIIGDPISSYNKAQYEKSKNITEDDDILSKSIDRYSNYNEILQKFKEKKLPNILLEDLCRVYTSLGLLSNISERERMVYLTQLKEFGSFLFQQNSISKYSDFIKIAEEQMAELTFLNDADKNAVSRQTALEDKIKEACNKAVIEYIYSGKDPNIKKADNCPNLICDVLEAWSGIPIGQVYGIDYRKGGLFSRQSYYILYAEKGMISNCEGCPVIQYEKISDVKLTKNGVAIGMLSGKRITIDFRKSNKSVYDFLSAVISIIQKTRILY
ncbi:MAG: tetratricopeptide repeat protein [Solobacterium sp.]|nr:tetratricopeptide repeat protein [Solobacterium sp.]